MKNFLLLLIPISIVACAGNEETVSDTINENTVTQDSIAMAPDFLDFVAYVNKLEKEIEYIDSAFAKHESSKANFSQEEKDSSFFIMKNFMNSFQITEAEQADYSEENYKRINKKYNSLGLEVWMEEGFIYLMPDIKFLEKKFKGDISVELDDYIEVLKVYFRQTTSDAGLSVEWSELSDMIIACEKYLVENEDSKYAEEVLSNYIGLMNFMLWGLDNTPIIDYWTDETQKQLNAEVAAVYQKLVKDDKHKTGKIIADHIEFLESKNYEFTYEEVQYLTTAEAKMYLGIE